MIKLISGLLLAKQPDRFRAERVSNNIELRLFFQSYEKISMAGIREPLLNPEIRKR